MKDTPWVGKGANYWRHGLNLPVSEQHPAPVPPDRTPARPVLYDSSGKPLSKYRPIGFAPKKKT